MTTTLEIKVLEDNIILGVSKEHVFTVTVAFHSNLLTKSFRYVIKPELFFFPTCCSISDKWHAILYFVNQEVPIFSSTQTSGDDGFSSATRTDEMRDYSSCFIVSAIYEFFGHSRKKIAIKRISS